MKSPILPILVLSLGLALPSSRGRADDSVELVVLNAENWNAYVIPGKEADAIYGDIALRNRHLSAVIAFPAPTRHANRFSSAGDNQLFLAAELWWDQALGFLARDRVIQPLADSMERRRPIWSYQTAGPSGDDEPWPVTVPSMTSPRRRSR